MLSDRITSLMNSLSQSSSTTNHQDEESKEGEEEEEGIIRRNVTFCLEDSFFDHQEDLEEKSVEHGKESILDLVFSSLQEVGMSTITNPSDLLLRHSFPLNPISEDDILISLEVLKIVNFIDLFQFILNCFFYQFNF